MFYVKSQSISLKVLKLNPSKDYTQRLQADSVPNVQKKTT